MSNRKITFTALIATIAMAASAGTYAASNPDKTAAFGQSRINASQAVAAAVAKVGGNATEVDFKHKNGQSYYEVEVVASGQKHEVKVDAASGKVINSKVENDKDSDAVKPAARVSLQQAIATAESKTGGRVKEADLKNKNGQTYYELETLNGNQKQEVKVDAASGQVLSAQAAK